MIEQAKIEAPNCRSMLLIAKLVLICAVPFAAGEVSWRLTGAQPVHSDLLAFDQFRRASRNSSSSVALIGSSRVLCDLDPKILKRELPKWEFYQLAIDGTSALPVLESLAQDGAFRGLVLCEFNISHLLEVYPSPEREDNRLWYTRFVQRRPYQYVRTWFYEALGQSSALVAASRTDFTVSLFSTVKNRLAVLAGKSRTPKEGLFPAELARREDRFLGLHRRGKDNSRAIARWAQMTRLRSPAYRDSGVKHVASWVQAIRRRGGDVVFIRMPVSGSLRQLEDDAYPDRDQAIESLSASSINVVDFAKESTLSGFDCPDESHLDAEDAERFSAALARILKDRQLLTRAASNAR